MEEEGGCDLVALSDCPLHLIPLDDDLLTLEQPCFRELFLDGQRAVLGEAAGRPRRGFRGGDETFVVVSGEDVLARRAVVRRLCAARVPRSVSPGLGELGGSTMVRALEANPRSRRSGVHQMGTMGVDALRRVSSRHVSRTRAPPGGST